jgi:hypothetical protein
MDATGNVSKQRALRWPALAAAAGLLAGCAPAERPQVAPSQAAVTAVRGELAAINRGSAEGVRAGSVFEIRRGQELIGRLRIGEVGEHSAAGMICDRRDDPLPGDPVVAEASRPGAGEPSPPAPVRGRITYARERSAMVDIGSDQGVKPGMVLLVVRGQTFVAHLRIAEVDATGSAGSLYDVVRPVEVGDRVTCIRP